MARRKVGFLVAIMLLAAATCQRGGPPGRRPSRVLMMTATAGYRHESIPAGLEAVKAVGKQYGFAVDATEGAEAFSPENLDRYEVVVFLNTTGDILDDRQQAALEAFVQGGGGFVGIHAAADTEYDWPWYGRLVGARFDGHGPVSTAMVTVVDDTHPSTRHLPPTWSRRDEWYDYRDVASGIRVLLEVSETPEATTRAIAWCREFDGGRSWYTGGGHTVESYRDPLFIEHLAGGINWAFSRTARGTGRGRSPGSDAR